MVGHIPSSNCSSTTFYVLMVLLFGTRDTIRTLFCFWSTCNGQLECLSTDWESSDIIDQISYFCLRHGPIVHFFTQQEHVA